MSESIQVTPGQNPKVVIAMALIAALTTIGASLVGVFPQVIGNSREKTAVYEQQQQIHSLQQELEQAKQIASTVTGSSKNNATVESARRMSIDGTVTTPDGKRLMNGVEVYLMPESNAQFTKKTDDSGKFIFNDIPPGQYAIIVREMNGMSGKGLLFEEENEVSVLGASIKYRVHEKGGRE